MSQTQRGRCFQEEAARRTAEHVHTALSGGWYQSFFVCHQTASCQILKEKKWLMYDQVKSLWDTTMPGETEKHTEVQIGAHSRIDHLVDWQNTKSKYFNNYLWTTIHAMSYVRYIFVPYISTASLIKKDNLQEITDEQCMVSCIHKVKNLKSTDRRIVWHLTWPWLYEIPKYSDPVQNNIICARWPWPLCKDYCEVDSYMDVSHSSREPTTHRQLSWLAASFNITLFSESWAAASDGT